MQPQLDGIHHLKIPVSDIDTSLAWFERVLDVQHETREDHVDNGERFAVEIEVPGVDIQIELRLAPKAARATAGYDPITFEVADLDALKQWAERFDDLQVTHSPIVQGYAGHTVSFDTPDGMPLRLYTQPEDGFDNIEIDESGVDPHALDTPLMARH